MPLKVVVVFNAPQAGRYQSLGESLAERGVLDEVNAVERALKEIGHGISLLPVEPPLEAATAILKRIETDVFFNLFEGFDTVPNSEATFAFALEATGIPFTGCPGAAIELAQDKPGIAARLEKNGFPTPRYQILGPDSISHFRLDFPCIVKPTAEHASHGLSADSVVRDVPALARQVKRISENYGGQALVEEFIDGREFNVTVMGNRDLTVLPVSEIIFDLPPEAPKILTFAAKWETGSDYDKGTRPFCPAEISSTEREKIGKTAKEIYRLTGCRGYARVDFRQDEKGIFKVIDVNPNPDISPGAGMSIQAAKAGMTYPDFVGRILMLALER